MQSHLSAGVFTLVGLLGASSCTRGYILSRQDAVRIRGMSEPEYERAKIKVRRAAAGEDVADADVTQQTPVAAPANVQTPITVRVHRLDLKHGVWLDAKRFRASAKRPYSFMILPGVLMLSVGIGLSVMAKINQSNDSCLPKSAVDQGGCFLRDLKTLSLGVAGGGLLAGGVGMIGLGFALWSPEVVDN